MSGAAGALELLVFAAVAACAVVLAVRATRLLVRRHRAGLGERVARPVVDSARVDAALQGLHTGSSDQLVAAVEADDAARDRRSALVLGTHPAQGAGASPGAGGDGEKTRPTDGA